MRRWEGFTEEKKISEFGLGRMSKNPIGKNEALQGMHRQRRGRACSITGWKSRLE